MIDALISYLTELKNDSLPTQVANLVAVLALLPALAVFSYRTARQRYRADIEEGDKLRHQLEASKALVTEVRRERDNLQKQVDTLEADSAKGFLLRMAKDARDGNMEREIQASEAFIAQQDEALHKAFATLTHAAIGYAAEDGAAGYENARLYARAALAVNRDDTMMRALSEELQLAAATAATGLKARPVDENTRAERLRKQALLPADLSALTKCFYDARDAGQYALMLEFAIHGERLARRLNGENARSTLIFKRHSAEANNWLGRNSIALESLETIHPLLEAVFGHEDPETLYSRHLIAHCLNDMGRAQEAHDAAAELLPLREEVIGERHPNTLSTRYLIAQCLNDMGQAQEAHDAAAELLPLEKEVNGERHPNTLSTRYLIAYCLADMGRAQETHDAAAELLPLEKEVNGEKHPSTLSTRYLIAQCLSNMGRAQEAHDAAAELLPLEEEVNGEKHPSTLTTRTLLAETLLALDRHQEARKIHAGVIEGLQTAGLIEEHRYLKRARELETRLNECP